VLNIPQKFTHKLYQSFIFINLNLYTHQPFVSVIIQWLIFNFWYKARGEDLHRKRNWPFQGGRIDRGINDGEFRRRFWYHWKKKKKRTQYISDDKGMDRCLKTKNSSSALLQN